MSTNLAAISLKRLFKKEAAVQTPLGQRPVANRSSLFKQYHCLNTLPPETLADLLSFAEQRRFLDFCPELNNKRILFFSRRATTPLLANIPTDHVEIMANYQLGDAPVSNQLNVFNLRGTLKPLPFRFGYFDLLLIPFGSSLNNEVLDHISAMAGLLKNGGRAIISVLHPTLEIFLTNQNPASKGRAVSSVQAYFTAFRDQNLYLETLSEEAINRENKTFFAAGPGREVTDDILGIPLVLFMRVVKYVKT
ncbi:MAG: hypothetical protein HYU99_08605 [Deltaproteobacteria bacterium]|nr:hypothetical protein [Deltaproteobacteria bacterium]